MFWISCCTSWRVGSRGRFSRTTEGTGRRVRRERSLSLKRPVSRQIVLWMPRLGRFAEPYGFRSRQRLRVPKSPKKNRGTPPCEWMYHGVLPLFFDTATALEQPVRLSSYDGWKDCAVR